MLDDASGVDSPPFEARLDEGWPEPIGASVRDGGVNFAVWSDHATRIELCLFGADGVGEQQRLPLHGPFDGVFHGFLPGAMQGLVYGLRAFGPYEPRQGHRFNPRKLLLDPTAREIVGCFEWRPEHHGYVLGEGADTFDERDNAPFALKARVAPLHPPLRHAAPQLHASERVLYEVHVKGFSRLCPLIPDALRGTYAGLAHPAAIAHFKRLGVTTLSLLPVHFALDEPMLPAGLVNYWGYNTLGFFAASPRLSCSPNDPTAVNDEFRRMVDALHAEGLEVVLDVVFNHTPEGNHFGPTISFRGLDQKSWYRVDADGQLDNFSACGNTVRADHPRVTQFVLDALRHWVGVMGVDGFRFDLAPVLGRGGADGAYSRGAAFFTALAQDPVLAHAVLIAEPWDAGPQGWRVGDFPGRWIEWNDHFRDPVRAFWLGRGGQADDRAAFVAALSGSPAIYRQRQRRPTASVNFVAVHDGFTLADVVSYSGKHSQANRENNCEANRDGRDDELCGNFGAEGPTDDPAINDTRQRVQRAMLATLLLARGTPMLCAGSEFGNTQGGNNNAWNQDNQTGWLSWPAPGSRAESGGEALIDFVAECTRVRRSHAALRRAEWTPTRPPAAQPEWTTHEPGDPGITVLELFAWLAEAVPYRLLVVCNPSPEIRKARLPAGCFECVLCSSGGQAESRWQESAEIPAHTLLLLASTGPAP